MTTTEIAEITTLIDTAKAFIRSYTGVRERTITGELVGVGNGETREFKITFPTVPDTTTIYADGVVLTETTDYTLDDTTGYIVFATAPESGAEISADYQTGLDAYNDFVLAVYVLVQSMYDNRAYYIDKSALNSVVEAILGMHCVNLL
ncbi:MAG: DUF2460 domain-containing protein [Prevotella sp.]